MAADTKDTNNEKAVKASAEEKKAAAEGDIANAVEAKEALCSTTGGAGEKTYSFVQLAGSTRARKFAMRRPSATRRCTAASSARASATTRS